VINRKTNRPELASLALLLVPTAALLTQSEANAPTSTEVSAREAAVTDSESEEEAIRLAEASLAVGGRAPLRIDRGKDQLALFIPRKEELVYEVNVAWGIIGTALGTVTMSSGVEPYKTSLLVPPKSEDEKPGETGWFKAHAYGEHLFYTLDATLDARHQPTEWPQIVYRSSQGGSENRRRELLIGMKDGKLTSSYRRDTDKGAPRGTRIWKEPVYREVPDSVIDMTSAVYLVRTFVARSLETAKFPVLDKKELWDMTLSKGGGAQQATPAGTFETVEIILIAKHYPGEEERKKKKFEGLFGLHGGIHLWVDRKTGVPVRIQGEIPAGPITLSVDISLASFKGTPSALKPIAAARD